MTHLEHLHEGLFCRLAKTSLFMRGNKNDTIGLLHEGFLAIGKNKLIHATP